MSLVYDEDPCANPDNNYRDEYVWRRAVLRTLCKLVPGAVTILAKVGLVDANGNDITAANPMPVTGIVQVSSMPSVTVNPTPGAATSALQTDANVLSTAANALLTTMDASLNNLETAVDDDEAFAYTEDATYTYLGWAAPGTADGAVGWKIARITNATGRKMWANGTKNYDKVWSNYNTYLYS